MGRHTGCNRGNTKKDSKEVILEALRIQRLKYKEAFDKVGQQLREVEERKIKLQKKYRDAKKLNKDKVRAKNKNDYYD